MNSSTTPTVALVGSWSDDIDDRRSMAAELAAVWPTELGEVAVFADADAQQRDELRRRSVPIWPEGAFGRHFHCDEFDHVFLMIGARLESILALARSIDEGSHVWLQHDVIDSDGFPVDAPTDWLIEVIGSARSVIVGSDGLAGLVRRMAPDGPPVLVLPPAHRIADPIVDTPDRVVVFAGDDEVHEYLTQHLRATIVRLDDSTVTPDVRMTRLLSARAGVDIRTTERGLASTTVTHMMAHGIPTITDLGAHAPFATSDGATGLFVVDGDRDDVARRVVDVVRPILDDDRIWLEASTAAKIAASSWTWFDVADVLAQWTSVVDSLPRSTVRVVGAVAS